MVFRKDNKAGDAFQRQMSALRQQLGGGEFEEVVEDTTYDPGMPIEDAYGSSSVYEMPVQRERERYVYEAAVSAQEPQVVSNEPLAPSIPTVDGETTVISPNATWKGEIVAEGSMHILGRFEGDIKVRDDLFILDDAMVDATIAAGTVIVSGRYTGTLNCGERLEVLPSGRLRGEIFAPALVVHNGAIINSKIKMTKSAESDKTVPTPVHRSSARGTA